MQSDSQVQAAHSSAASLTGGHSEAGESGSDPKRYQQFGIWVESNQIRFISYRCKVHPPLALEDRIGRLLGKDLESHMHGEHGT